MGRPLTAVQTQLFAWQDVPYKEFQQKLIPTVLPQTIIGVRTPVLRKYAAALAKTEVASEFLNSLPHYYFEENNLHAFLIERSKDYAQAIELTEEFLPYIDNWATCDSFAPKIFKKYPAEVLEKIQIWVRAEHNYTVRYGIGLLLSNYLDTEFSPELLELAASARHDDYYIKMMVAWYFATALAKQYPQAVRYIEQRRLEPWVHNKTIQKAIESRRISAETKAYLRSCKV